MKNARFDVHTVSKAAAQYGWLNILATIAPSLEEATKKVGRHVPCPVNGGKDGFRLFKDAPFSGAGFSNKEGAFGDGFSVLEFATGLPFKEVLTLVANQIGLTDEKPLYMRPMPVVNPAQAQFISKKDEFVRKNKLNGFWGQSSKLKPNDRVVNYLRSRGIKGDWVTRIESIRLHPNAWYYSEEGKQFSAPAMALKYQLPNGKAVNIHKTFLSTKTVGKNELMETPKLMMKPLSKMRGGAVRIGGIEAIKMCEGILHVTEGFENAATIADIFFQPSWAALNWALLQGFQPPKEVKTLVIWADNDPLDLKGNNAGLDAAKKLASRLSSERPGMKIIIKVPPRKKEDWNDLYQKGNLDLFSLENL